MLRLTNLVLARGAKRLLDGANLTVHAGHKVGLIGPNGSGKSSLFALILGDLHQDAGSLDLPPAWTIAHVAQETPAALVPAIEFVLDGDRELREIERALAATEAAAANDPEPHGEALALLGTPSTTSTVGGDAWYYIGQKMQHTLSFLPVKMTDQHVLAVYFDKGGKVTRIANYGIKDGKVFDFVSRTTPTGGSEPDFLKNIMGGLFKFT